MNGAQIHNVIDLEKLFNTKTVVDQVCTWNAARYDQEYDSVLATELLLEEMQELLAAHRHMNFVEILDGLGDLFFVAIGCLWKRGLDAQGIVKMLDALTDAEIPPVPTCVIGFVEKEGNSALAHLVLSCIKELEDLLGKPEHALDVIRAICISNDTKEVVKTASSVKANGSSKGPNYKSPTKDLIAIIDRAYKEGRSNGKAS